MPPTSTTLQLPNSPLSLILAEVGHTHKQGLHYASLLISLTIPDICSAAETKSDEQGRFRVESRYKAWCKKYMSSRIKDLTPDDLWALRGGMIHQGQTFGHPKSRFERVIFALNSPNVAYTATMGNGNKRAYSITIQTFIIAMLEGAIQWFDENQCNDVVKGNLDGLIRPREGGFPPYIGGKILVIA